MALAPPQATLAKRLAAARTRITTTARAEIDLAAERAPPAPKPKLPKPPKNQAPTGKTQNTTPHAPAQTAKAKGRKGKATEGRADAVAASLPDRLRQMAENPAALAFISDAQLVEIFDAMVSNAATKGSTGAMDRQALFRAAGLPFQGGIGARSGAGRGKAGGAEIAGRLETALERSRRRVPVTDTAADDESPVETAA